jgi:hypothetical protein
LKHALGLLDVLDEGRLLLFQEYWGFDKLLPLVREIPNKDAFRSSSPEFSIVIDYIVNILCMADVDLMWLPQKRIVPHFHKGIISNAKQKMAVFFEVNRIELIPMQSLHFHLDCHFDDIIAANRCIFKNNP